jgi:hypothetical protein
MKCAFLDLGGVGVTWLRPKVCGLKPTKGAGFSYDKVSNTKNDFVFWGSNAIFSRIFKEINL